MDFAEQERDIQAPEETSTSQRCHHLATSYLIISTWALQFFPKLYLMIDLNSLLLLAWAEYLKMIETDKLSQDYYLFSETVSLICFGAVSIVYIRHY